MFQSICRFLIKKYVLYFSLCFSLLSIYSIYQYDKMFQHSFLLFALNMSWHFIMAVFFIYSFIKLFQINRYLYLFATFIFIFLFAFFLFLEVCFNIAPSEDLVLTLLGYNGDNSKINFSLLNYRFIIFFVTATILWFISVLPALFYSKEITFFNISSLIIGLFLFAISLKMPTISAVFVKDDIIYIYPHKVFHPIGSYFLNLRPFLTNIKNSYDFFDQLTINKKAKPLTIVFFMGETTRGDRFSWNGYRKNTNEFTQRLKTGFVNYGVSKSSSNNTVKSVPCIFTNFDYAEQKNLPQVLLQKSMLTLFEKGGYKSYSIGIKESLPLSRYLNDAQVNYYLKPEDTLETVFTTLSFQIIHQSHEKRFILLRNMGSHYPYSLRYPQNFEKFKPVCSTFGFHCSQEALDNTFDNTVYYVDYTISKIIETLKTKGKNQNILFVYTSDHGESLGENGMYLHPTSGIENREVPLIFWVNDSFKKNFTQQYQQLLKHSQQYYGRVGSYVLWHTLLDLVGFKNKSHDNSPLDFHKSLVNPLFSKVLDKNWRSPEVFKKNQEEDAQYYLQGSLKGL